MGPGELQAVREPVGDVQSAEPFFICNGMYRKAQDVPKEGRVGPNASAALTGKD